MSRKTKSHVALVGATLAMAGFVAMACGGSSKKVDTVGTTPTTPGGQSPQNGGPGGGSGGGCTDANCAKTTMDVYSDGFGGPGLLLGVVDEPVKWNILVKSLDSQDRRVGVLLDKIPKGSKMDPEPDGKTALNSEIKIVWTPDKELKSTDDLKVHMRDLTYCFHLAKKNRKPEETCYENKPNAETDTVISLKWQTMTKDNLQNQLNQGGGNGSGSGGSGDQNVVDIDDQALCNNGKPPTSNQEIQGKVISGLLGTLQGGLSPQLIGGLLGGLSGGSGGGSTGTPQECVKP